MSRSMRSSTGSAASSHGRVVVAVTSVMSVGLHVDLGGGGGGGAPVGDEVGDEVGGADDHSRAPVGVAQWTHVELAAAGRDPADAVPLGADDVADREVVT